ncbi:helix-turn-helix domain-containing protein [Actinoplanes sp. NPDC049118]|uniref:ArsR/SmtB family transcription factor n=1 Tax=Actinoplanes sp. NPDC049118 TaxID=3155769 RepID=UPI0033EC2A81
MASSTEPARLGDAGVMRALAHPIRLRIFALLSETGPASVSALAGQTGESTASVSYHLSQLARFGLVEEAVEARTGRERPWRVQHGPHRDRAGAAEAPPPAAHAEERIHLGDVGHLTAAELAAVSAQIRAVLAGYRRPDPADRPAGARRVSFFAYGLPHDG